ncbi:hypothetical protein [Sulfuricella sp. T08]|uniref:hypothetical protein n=1 Tax=Sulfuricella sp. T08 TaxID=1632857 RepID=UPI0011856B1D|nr:hypothetical protein [Sulfuricella sp. T08]
MKKFEQIEHNGSRPRSAAAKCIICRSAEQLHNSCQQQETFPHHYNTLNNNGITWNPRFMSSGSSKKLPFRVTLATIKAHCAPLLERGGNVGRHPILLGLDNCIFGLGEVVHADVGVARTVRIIHDQAPKTHA